MGNFYGDVKGVWGRKEMDCTFENDNDVELQNSELNESETVENVTETPAASTPAVENVTGEENQRRTRRAPAYLDDFVVTNDQDSDSDLNEHEGQHSLHVCEESDPLTYEEAAKCSKWREAMDSEIASIERNDTWELVDLPKGGKKIGVKWVYKTKYNEEGVVEKHKARLVAKGYALVYGVDYSEVFAPVARWDTIRAMLAVAVNQGWKVYQLDVKSAFLHGNLEETVLVEQPKSYERRGSEQKVYRLKKALYGLKQAPRAWYSRIEGYFIKEGFTKCPHEHTLFTKEDSEGAVLVVSLYVDDLIFIGSNEKLVDNFRNSMKNEFDMTDLGVMRYFLGVEVIQRKNCIFITQQRYAREVLDRFSMGDSKPLTNPVIAGSKIDKDEEGKPVDSTMFKQIVGSLMYLNATRPDLMYSVSLISRYMERPTEKHFVAAKRILRYLNGTQNLGILYQKCEEQELIAYCDSDYAGDLNDRKSTSGFVFMLSSVAIAWSSRKQPIVTLSTTEAEYVAAVHCVTHGIWLKRILEELRMKQGKCLNVLCDNNSAIRMSKNPVMHGRTKHIDVQFHFLRNLCRDGLVELKYCASQVNIADTLTKPMKNEAFIKFRRSLGVCSAAEIEDSVADKSC